MSNYFYAYKETTIKECLTFMLRCLQDPKTVEWNKIFELAKEQELITDEEYSTIKEDTLLTKDFFETLLKRMLHQDRYLYWVESTPEEDYDYDERKKMDCVDESGSIRYID